MLNILGVGVWYLTSCVCIAQMISRKPNLRSSVGYQHNRRGNAVSDFKPTYTSIIPLAGNIAVVVLQVCFCQNTNTWDLKSECIIQSIPQPENVAASTASKFKEPGYPSQHESAKNISIGLDVVPHRYKFLTRHRNKSQPSARVHGFS